MSEMAMKYEDWLRGCVHHDGRKGNVYLPCDMVLAIADWIEAHRDVAPVRHGKWIYHMDDLYPEESTMECSVCGDFIFIRGESDNYCPNCGAKMGEGE